MSEITDPRVSASRPPVDDPDLTSNGELSLLDVLKEVAEPFDSPDVVFSVRTRDGWAVRYSTDIDADQLKLWQKRSKDQRGDIEEIRLASIMLANLCVGLIRNGNDLTDNGEPVTFAHPDIWRLYNASRAADAVRSFYSLDTYLVSTCNSLLREAGWGEEIQALDPTQDS